MTEGVIDNGRPMVRTDSGIIDGKLNTIVHVLRRQGSDGMSDNIDFPATPPQRQTPAPERPALSPTSLTLLNVTPPVVVAAVCKNLIERFEFTMPAKTFLYVLAMGVTFGSFRYTSGLLHGYKTSSKPSDAIPEPRHINLGIKPLS